MRAASQAGVERAGAVFVNADFLVRLAWLEECIGGLAGNDLAGEEWQRFVQY